MPKIKIYVASHRILSLIQKRTNPCSPQFPPPDPARPGRHNLPISRPYLIIAFPFLSTNTSSASALPILNMVLSFILIQNRQ